MTVHHQGVERRAWRRAVYTAVFALGCTVLASLLHLCMPVEGDVELRIRAAALDALSRDDAAGRQSLVCSLNLMPVPAVAALPAALLPGITGRAALLHAMAFWATLGGFGSWRRARSRGARYSAAAALASALLPVAVCLWFGLGAGFGAAFLFLGAILDGARDGVLRAIAGLAYGAAAFCAAPMLLLVLLRVAAGLVAAGVRRRADVAAEQALVSMEVAYVAVTYLFLSWTIMGNAGYALRRPVAWKLSARHVSGQAALDTLHAALGREYRGYMPVLAGPWSFAANHERFERAIPLRVIDFHPDKLPAWDRRDPLLVLPAPANPLYAFADRADDAALRDVGAVLELGRDRYWRYLAVAAPGPPAPAGQ